VQGNFELTVPIVLMVSLYKLGTTNDWNQAGFFHGSKSSYIIFQYYIKVGYIVIQVSEALR
jgi:hypothetical protein